ncbi:MAG: 23S rRNA (guanosine(2251)-2'-O)-methyltransferase RlmB [Acholeplasmataceae bacterium]
MIIYGKNAVKEAIFAKRPLYQVYIDENSQDSALLAFLDDKKIKYQKKPKGFLNNLTDNAVHQGIVADVKPYSYKGLDDVLDSNKQQRFLVLDGIEDPHNLGAIMRTAEAIQLDGIILSKKRQVPLSGTVAKVSSGAIEYVDLILVSNINQAIQKLKDHHVLVVGTAKEAETPYDSLDLNQSIAIVLGNEGEGMRALVKKNCDVLVTIPMFGKINSLNVSVAAALLMYAVKK